MPVHGLVTMRWKSPAVGLTNCGSTDRLPLVPGTGTSIPENVAGKVSLSLQLGAIPCATTTAVVACPVKIDRLTASDDESIHRPAPPPGAALP